MKADIESQLLLLDNPPESAQLSEEQMMYIEERKRFLKMFLDSPCYQINEKVLNFVLSI